MKLWRLLPVLLLASSAARAEGHRWLLVAGQNAGDARDERLRFADSDARHFLEVMQEVGAVRPETAVALYGATESQLRRALEALRPRLSKEDQLFVYFSGHADGGELHLDGSRFSLAELNAFVREAPVAVGVLIIDACRSGAVTRLKGLHPAPDVALQVDVAEVRGRVVITASGADEWAQESDALDGSHFTHHLVAGLRGAADSSHDGRVSLSEAYAYAYSRTVDSSLGTSGGLQRPNFRVDLRGQGELVLSELQQGRAHLSFESAPPGRWQLLSLDGSMVAQVDKGAGRTELVVPPGEYRVSHRVVDGELTRTVRVTAGDRIPIRSEELSWRPLPRVKAKGSPALVTASLGATGASALLSGLAAMPGVEGRVHASFPGSEWWLNTGSFALIYRTGEGQRLVPFRQSELELRLGWSRTFDLGRFCFVAGPEVGALLALQSGLPDGTSRIGLEPTLSLTGDARIRLVRSLGLFLSASGGGVLVRKATGIIPVPRASLSGGVVFEI